MSNALKAQILRDNTIKTRTVWFALGVAAEYQGTPIGSACVEMRNDRFHRLSLYAEAEPGADDVGRHEFYSAPDVPHPFDEILSIAEGLDRD